MRTIHCSRRGFAATFLIILTLLGGMAAAAAIESEGESFVRERVVGNLGVVYTNVGVYPDRGPDPVPERTTAGASVSIPAGAEIVESLIYWAGRGPGWSDPSIEVNQTTVTADTDYSWTWPGFTQSTYVADLAAAGVELVPGANLLSMSGLDQNGGRFYGVGVLVIYSHPDLPEVELELLEGNEFAFMGETFFDDVGNGGTHASVICSEFAPALTDRNLSVTARVMGIDAGRGDGPPRTQRYQWWTGTDPIEAPVVDGLVGIPATAPSGSIDNPVTTRVAPTEEWGSETFTTTDPVLAAGDTHFCNQLQSVNIGDGFGASLSLTDHAVTAQSVYRLGNLVWLDLNEDGQADLDEPGLDGVTVELRRAGSPDPIATTVTADDGSYLFEGLVCGTYTVSIPGGQGTWTVAGNEIDSSELLPGTIVSPTPDDDTDNDTNGLVDDAGITSGPITIGDCGEDGDFSNNASSEPTNETNRVGGPDDDPDDVSPADGNYDDVRSNTSIDFSFTPGEVEVEVEGEVECADEDDAGEDADAGEGADDGEPGVAPGDPCDEPAPCDDAAGGEGADDGEPGDPCDEPAPCDDAAGGEGADDGANADDGDPCEPADPCADHDAGADNNDPANADDAANCDEADPCAEQDPAAPNNAPANADDAANCDEQPVDDGDDEDEPQDTPVTPEDPDDVEVEVEGQVEINEDQNDPDLAVTGSSSTLLFLGALMILVLGAWFAVAGIWMRPTR